MKTLVREGSMTLNIEDQFLWQLGENIDRLVTIDVMSYGVIGPLFEAAREVNGGAPLCLSAAARLRERVKPGDTVLLTTGLILPGHYPYGETDGPIGTAVLARALALGLGARVLVAVERELMAVNSALLRTAELQVISAEALAREDGQLRAVASVVELPREVETARAASAAWIAEYGVKAVVAIEKPGANSLAIYHMVGGVDISADVGKGQTLFEVARENGVLTIGIGDRGNELGMGPIAVTARALLPRGSACGCPCGRGVADETGSDLAVLATVSNWGAYGVAACLAALLEQPDLIQSSELETALFATAVREGGVDGMTGRASPSADGVALNVHVGVVHMLAEIYRGQSARNPGPFSTPLVRKGHSRHQPRDGNVRA
jgi:hypothetical protein